jgi:glycosyltransferase involved in cell wall biosynthesis
MNVGILTAYPEPIGFNYGVLKFCHLAPTYGVKPVLIALTRHPYMDNRLIHEAHRLGIHVETLHERFRYDPKIFPDLVRLVDRLQLQLLDLQTYKPMMLGLVARYFRPQVRLVSWIHGYTRENIKIQLFGMVERYLHRFMNKIICVSKPFVEMLIEKGIDRRLVAIVPNAIDEDEPAGKNSTEELRNELGLTVGTKVVGAIGRLSPEKGHVYLIRAWEKVSRTMPQARLILVGDGPSMESLRQEVKRLEVEDSVLFTGFRPDGRRFFSLFDLMVLPSLEEGLPYVLLESMIHRVPVVASRVGEVPTVLDGGRYGSMVEPGDINSMADHILTLLNKPDEASKLAITARDHILTHYSQKARTEQIIEVYNGIL